MEIKEFIEIKNNALQNIGIMLAIFKEDKYFIVYSPSLNICSHGETEDKAKQSFEVMLEEFFKYTLNKKTLNSVLIELGWKAKSKIKKFSKSFENKNIDKDIKHKDVPYHLLPFNKNVLTAKHV